MNIMTELKKNSWPIIMVLFVVCITGLSGKEKQFRKGTSEYFSQGVNKEWSEIDYRQYANWLSSVRNRQSAIMDDQILRRQWAIINGNKITAEIWNYASISSPGNRITDIVWEGLGYGYEFGPMVCAEVEVTPLSHQDAYRWYRNDSLQVINLTPVTTGQSFEPYQLKWQDEIYFEIQSIGGIPDTTLVIELDSIAPLVGSNVFSSKRAISGQSGYYLPIHELSLDAEVYSTYNSRDSIVIESMDNASSSITITFSTLSNNGHTIEAKTLPSISSYFTKFSENENVYVHILPGKRAIWNAHVISEGLISYPEVSEDNTEFWGWDPLAYSDLGVPYADPNSDHIPTSGDVDRIGDGKPDSWPYGWYNANLQEYVWPGALRQGSSNADLESFFVIDDRNNKEFDYYPFINDSTRRGLGIEVECRYYQWSNPLAEDIIFLIYKVTNKSDKDLHNVIFGMWGDPHIGGPSDWADDLSYFDRDINMVYAWDEDGLSDIAGKSPGYFGYKFLESPGDPHDGIDNDNDGMVDESRSNGIDDDGDWNPEKHDVGLDGLPNTGDEGEGDGIPTAGDPFDIRIPGEPNFEWTDLDEADMLGLTGFKSPPFLAQNAARNDQYFYENFLIPGEFDTTNSTVSGDYIFLYSSGAFDFPAGEARRFSIALLVGQDQEDLTLNAITAQDIYEKNYEFAKPPAKPNVVAVPGDEKVTLYWDDIAESSIDPLSNTEDFEGYVIYRSTDPQFLDQQTITDANGSRFLFEPLKLSSGASAKFDLDNEYIGLSTIPFANRGVYYNLGNNTGIVHSFVDSNHVINGQEYYYAVVSYDHGDDSLQIAPVECSKRITVDPERNETLFDVNTLKVIPRSPSAGYVKGQIDNNVILHTGGVGTGDIEVEVIDPAEVEDENTFIITFSEDPTMYYVQDMSTIETDLVIRHGQYISLPNRLINDSTFVLTDENGNTVPDTLYALNFETGKILGDSALIDNGTYHASYQYYGVYGSTLLDKEESNPVFDGMKIFIKDEPLELDESRMGWNTTSPTTLSVSVKPFNNIQDKKYPADYQVRFFDSLVDSSSQSGKGYIKTNFEIWEVSEGMTPEKRRMIILELSATKDSLWSPGERVIILQDSVSASSSWEFTMSYTGQDSILPLAGDSYYIATTRPFASSDIYEFKTVSSHIDNSLAKSDLDRIAAVPNPYVVTNVIERADIQNRTDRGPRKMYFNHLPNECTIRIFTLSGELVKTIYHNSTIDDGKEYWDLTTKDNFPIAYGIYVYHVDAGELGEKIGRFGVIK